MKSSSMRREMTSTRCRPAGGAAARVAAIVAMYGLFNVFAAQQARNPTVPSPLAAEYGLKEPPEPRLQTEPVLDLQKLRARDAERLSTYAWVDRDAGVVRLPIERAIEILAARGLPARRGGVAGVVPPSGRAPPPPFPARP